MNINSSSFTLDWSFQKTQTFDTMPDYQTFRQAHIASNRNRRERYYSIQITVQNSSGFEIQKTKLSCLTSTQDINQVGHESLLNSPNELIKTCVEQSLIFQLKKKKGSYSIRIAFIISLKLNKSDLNYIENNS